MASRYTVSEEEENNVRDHRIQPCMDKDIIRMTSDG